jgi:hypothetical protein
MNIHRLPIRTLLLPELLWLASLSVCAQPQTAPVSDLAAPPVQLSRAEVLADLQVWRESGLALLAADPGQAPFTGSDYQQARTRYERMRASPGFAELVNTIARRKGEPVPTQASATSRPQQ